jgi:hypothetical protein
MSKRGISVSQTSLVVLASVFLLTSVKCPDKAQKLMVKEMQHEDTTQRINAVLR